MQRILGWLLLPLHLTLFLTTFGVFHVAQVLARPFGYGPHKRVVDYLNLSLLGCLKILGTRIDLRCDHELPVGRPLIVVANHQSFYDIPMLGWLFRGHHPKYVAKTQLGKGIPSLSYNLRHGGSVLLDREEPRAAMRALQKFGKQVEELRQAACIFPEGTRARDGKMRPFKPAGLMTLIRTIPSAVIVPVAIDGSWELLRYRMRPIPFGIRVRCTALEPIDRGERSAKELVAAVEARIRHSLGQPRTPGSPGATSSRGRGPSCAAPSGS